ncbi:hypothetical protein W97_07939 [Coniosporium apollinis CBS 100218]|uniref:ML-like domain-containing protein n=1 Tax=Coniosporium apollinis (strain CBS 100218) TaxID=1168221 RepID=R7Z446_CONA1|nr:uncharacterized protein W97_07939 [Coniosporium apollinis CBS 100218]EON68681.1 hypothetical protein W97_07939 [Coniosporium apollinis CBS 100218]
MRSLLRTPFTLLVAALLTLIPLSSAVRLIESRSLNPCQANSRFSATLFNVIFTPDNRTLSFEIVGVSAIQGNVIAEFEVIAYGYTAIKQRLNPCESADLKGLCPMNTGTINIESNVPLSDEVVRHIPGIAYTIPDLDGIVQVHIHDAETGESLACVEAALSNGKTVYQKGVGWVTAIIAGTGLVASAITNGLGHSNTAAHVAANALSLFGYFQAQAIIGMSAVPLPPIVSSWTQNFQWSMGIIRIGFLQRMATWYQRSTGGTPSTILSTLATTSVQVQKRSLEVMHKLVSRALGRLSSRTNADSSQAETNRVITVRGIERVGFRAHIEITNIFLTGYSLFVVFVLFVIIGVVLFKLTVEGLAKGGKMKGDKFQDFRNGWKTVLKGIMFRIVLIGFPQMVVLCFWELTQRDSAAEVALAILTIVTMTLILGWASSKVIRIAQRSIAMHKNPAYILYSDPVSLNKWGFLYVQFKATAYYFIVPVLFHVLLKGMFIGLGQESAVVQAIALVLIEAGLLIAVSIMRPYMDKKTNAFNISICAVNFVSSIFLLVFTDIFDQPGLVTGVMGVIFFIFNAAFALILLLMVLFSSGYALFSKNPDTRYQPMRDDRGSFIKSQTQLTTELDALGATARGEGNKNGAAGFYGKSRIEDADEEDSLSSGTLERRDQKAMDAGVATPASQSTTAFGSSSGGYAPADARQNSPSPYFGQRSDTSSPAPVYRGAERTGTMRSERSAGGGYRQQNSASPWQRGAGYEG